MTRPPLLRDRLPEILGDRPWWDTPHSIRIRPARARGGWAMTPPGRLDVSGSSPYVVEFRGHDVTAGFIVREILECERTGRGYLDRELWDAVRTRPPRSWARRAAARLAALLERFAA
jgi:hypothetical protein